MEALDLKIFLEPVIDREICEYKILNYLKHARIKFNSNRLYPELAELRVLVSRLETIIEQNSYIKIWQPQKTKSAIIKGKYISLESENTLNQNDVTESIDLIEWALERFYLLIDEGLIIFNFVMQNLELEPIGKPSNYKDHGYLIVPDNKNSLTLIFNYECSMGYAAHKPIRSVKTNLIESIPFEITSGISKSELLKVVINKNELLNRSAYYCITDLDFDPVESLLPAAKKKLIAEIS